MKFPYVVRHNGVDYPIGADVPVGDSACAEKEVAETKVAKTVEETEEKVCATYSRTEINRMPVADLRELAVKLGVRNAKSVNGTELKRAVVDFLNI